MELWDNLQSEHTCLAGDVSKYFLLDFTFMGFSSIFIQFVCMFVKFV